MRVGGENDPPGEGLFVNLQAYSCHNKNKNNKNPHQYLPEMSELKFLNPREVSEKYFFFEKIRFLYRFPCRALQIRFTQQKMQ